MSYLNNFPEALNEYFERELEERGHRDGCSDYWADSFACPLQAFEAFYPDKYFDVVVKAERDFCSGLSANYSLR